MLDYDKLQPVLKKPLLLSCLIVTLLIEILLLAGIFNWGARILLICAAPVIIIFMIKPEFSLYATIIVGYSGIASSLFQGLFLPLIVTTTGLWLLSTLINQDRIHFTDRQTVLYFILGLLILSSTLYAKDQGGSLAKILEFGKYLLLYFLIIHLVKSEKQIRLLFWLIVVSGLCMFTFGLYYSFVAGEAASGMRLISLVQDPNSFAIKLLPAVGFSYALFKIEEKNVLKLLALLSLMLLSLCIVVTFSRGGLMGLITILGLISWVEFRNKKGILFGITIFVILVITIPPELIFLRIQGLSTTKLDSSILQRLRLLKGGLHIFLEHPLIGVGAGNFMAYSRQYAGTLFPMVAHNSFLEVAAELGIIGLTVFISLISTTIKRLRKTFSNHTSYTITQYVRGVLFSLFGFLTHSLFLSEEYNIILFLLIALAVILNRFPNNIVLKSNE
ncbi:O-antigen ligase family protein [bacterium]|nr:O-antigen ligase family protein [bacterium]